MSNEMNEAKRTAACASDYLGTVATDEAEASVSVFDEWKKSGECHCKGKCTCGKRGPMGHFTKIEPIAEKVEGSSDKVLKGLLEKAKKAGDKAKEDAYAHLLADSNDAKIAFVQYDAKKTEELKDLLKSYKANVASSDEWVAWAKKNGKPDNMTQGDFDAFTVRQKDYGEQMQKHVDAIKRVLKMRGEKGYAQDEGEFKEDEHPRGSDGKFAKKGEEKLQAIKEEKAKFTLEFKDGTKVTFLALDENAAKLIAGGVAKKLGREVKEVKMVEKPKMTADAHNLVLGMDKVSAKTFIGDTINAGVKGSRRTSVDTYRTGMFTVEVDFPKIFGKELVDKRDELRATLGKIFPAALLKMHTPWGTDNMHVVQYSDSTRIIAYVPSYNLAKEERDNAEGRVKFSEHECATYDKANAEGKLVGRKSEFDETFVSDRKIENEVDRLYQESMTYRMYSKRSQDKIGLIHANATFNAIKDCYAGGETAEKAVADWNKKHPVGRVDSEIRGVAMDESEQFGEDVAAFDEMEFELHATFDEENGEITIPMTAEAFDSWDEQKHPRNHGKFAKKGEGGAVSSLSDVELGKKIADVRNGKSKDDLAKLTAEQDRRYAAKCAKMSDEELEGAIESNRKLVERYGKDKNKNPYVRDLEIAEKEMEKRSEKEAKANSDLNVKHMEKQFAKGKGSVAKFRITEIHGKFAVEPNLPRFVDGKANAENIDKIVKGRKFFDKKEDAEAHLKKVNGQKGDTFTGLAAKYLRHSDYGNYETAKKVAKKATEEELKKMVDLQRKMFDDEDAKNDKGVPLAKVLESMEEDIANRK